MDSAPIPRILHQTWRDDRPPPRLAAWRDGWRRLHPHWEHRFYTDADIRRWIARHRPEWGDLYAAYRHPIQRVDLFRYLVVHHHGGLYADLDMACRRPVDPLLAAGGCVLSVEAHLTRAYQAELGYRRPVQIANCIFAAPPGHPFLARLLDRLRRQGAGPVPSDGAVEEATGPRRLTRTYFDLPAGERRAVRLLPQIHLMAPTVYPDLFPFDRRVYARHHCAGTWKRAGRRVGLRRRLVERSRLPRFW